MLATWGCTTFPKPTLSLDFLGATSLDSGITFSRGSQATLFDSTGTLVYAKHNLLTYSEDFANAAWTKAGTNISSDATVAPNGALTGDAIVEDTANSEHTTYRFITADLTTAANAHTFSVYIKANGRTKARLSVFRNTAPFPAFNGNFDLSAVTVTTTQGGTAVATGASITSVGNGWYRCVLSGYTGLSGAHGFQLLVQNAAGNTTYTGDGTSGLFIWGAQLNIANMEGGVTSSLTTYYPTTTAAYYAPRFDYNPSTLQPRGLLIEEQRTNGIRNNTMQGAVAGTPGTLPTNWITLGAGLGTLTQQIVGIGTSAGITYIDIRISGTTSTASYGFGFDATTQIAALAGQSWTSAIYLALAGGATTNLTVSQRVVERNNVGTPITSTATNITSTLGTSLSRFSTTRTLTEATTAFVTTDILVSFSAGVAIDITLRIGLPQLEQGAFATSVIPTTTTALTRNADVASMTGTNFSSWYNAAAGTFFAAGGVVENGGSILSVHDGSTSNSIAHIFRFSNSSRTWTFASSVEQTNITNSVSGNVKHAFAYATNDFAQSVNGLAAVTDTSASVPTVTQLSIGTRVTGNYLNGHIQRISFWPTRLPNATLQALTA